jgi:glycerol uptake facilitator-like aquaporin
LVYIAQTSAGIFATLFLRLCSSASFVAFERKSCFVLFSSKPQRGLDFFYEIAISFLLINILIYLCCWRIIRINNLKIC